MAIIQAEEIRSVLYSDIEATYLPLGAVTAHPWRMFKITNTTDGDMMISMDGSTDMFILPEGSFTLYDVSTNVANVSNLDSLVVGTGVQFYVRYLTIPTGGTGGDVWLEGLYAKGE